MHDNPHYRVESGINQPTTLATTCADCGHPMNWHKGNQCSANAGIVACSCQAFAPTRSASDEPCGPRCDCGACDDTPVTADEQMSAWSGAPQRWNSCPECEATWSEPDRSAEVAALLGRCEETITAQRDRIRDLRTVLEAVEESGLIEGHLGRVIERTLNHQAIKETTA